jgi:hypothetical protein
MKEAYAVRRTVPPSAEIEARIEHMLSVGVGENPRESLAELARLGARLIIQRAVEDEFDAWLGRARYERRPHDQREQRREESGLRNGFRPRRVQTAEGELSIEIPQVRQAAETFASKLFPRTPKLLRTEPLKALVIGAFVRGLSMRDVESLCEQAGLGEAVEVHGLADVRGAQGNALSGSGAVTSMRSGWSRCFSMRRSSRSDRTGPTKASRSRGGSPKTATACCWR